MSTHARKPRVENGGDDELSRQIMLGLGGKANISDVDCCITRLRCTVHDAAKVDQQMLKDTGASGVICKGTGVQVGLRPARIGHQVRSQVL